MSVRDVEETPVTLFGVVDIPHLMVALWRRRGIKLRSLGDHAHFQVPVWRRIMRETGVVDGTRENCAAAFRQRQCVLVFPGGARESFKGTLGTTKTVPRAPKYSQGTPRPQGPPNPHGTPIP